MTDRVILAIQYTPVSTASAVRRAVGGFLRYVQYRDKHRDSDGQPVTDPKVSGLLKYVAYRDRSTPRGLLFGPEGPAGDAERRELASFVARSVATTRPQLATTTDGTLRDRRRAVYRLVISPERAEGLDLRDLTRAALQQLARDAGVGSGLRWVAAEHRNTKHPHVHVVLAAFAEEPDGHVRGLVVNRARLQRMKETLVDDICRQRDAALDRTLMTAEPVGRRHRPARRRASQTIVALRSASVTPSRPRGGMPVGLVSAMTALRRAAVRYRAEVEREQRELDRQRGRER